MSKSKERIRESQLRYKKGLGQNFIYDEELLARLAELSGIGPQEDVLEIGPGTGGLTRQLCLRAGHVLSIELDERLIPLLQGFLSDCSNVTLLQGDALALDLAAVTEPLRKPFSVVANIPYYITTPLITRLLTAGLPLNKLALMVQKEVAQKLLSAPGEEGWGMLALRCRYYGTPELALEVPASCFTPKPQVDSAFVVIPLRKAPAVAVKDEACFFRVAAAAFSLRRKTMVNCLCATLRLPRQEALSLMAEAGLDEMIRGEKLTLEELGRLADLLTDREQQKEEKEEQS